MQAQQAQGERLQVGDVEIDAGSRCVTVSGREVTLSPKEFDLLKVLASHPGRACWAATSP